MLCMEGRAEQLGAKAGHLLLPASSGGGICVQSQIMWRNKHTEDIDCWWEELLSNFCDKKVDLSFLLFINLTATAIHRGDFHYVLFMA